MSDIRTCVCVIYRHLMFLLYLLLLLARSGKGPSQGGGGGIPHQDVSYLCIFFIVFHYRYPSVMLYYREKPLQFLVRVVIKT